MNRILVLIFILLVSCGKKEVSSPKPNRPVVEKFNLVGSPLNIIDGATLNKDIALNSTNFLDYNDYYLDSLYIFYVSSGEKFEKSSLKQISNRDILNLKDKGKKEGYGRPLFNFRKVGSRFLYSSDKFEYTFEFIMSGQGFVLSQLTDKNDGYVPIRFLHFGESDNKETFSLLFTDKDGTLVAAYFTKHLREDVPTHKFEDIEYNYLHGKGVKVNWKREVLNVSICGKEGLKYAEQIIEYSEQWNEHMENFKIVTNKVDNFLPFSDPRSSCIMVIDNYLIEDNKNEIVLGSTTFATNWDRGELVDADIFIWSREYITKGKAKTFKEYVDNNQVDFNKTITHEVGHMIGLDHIFDGTVSIMSYDKWDSYISSYDVKSINELYP